MRIRAAGVERRERVNRAHLVTQGDTAGGTEGGVKTRGIRQAVSTEHLNH